MNNDGYTNGRNGHGKVDVDVTNPYISDRNNSANAKVKEDYDFPKSIHPGPANAPVLQNNPRKKKGLKVFLTLGVVVFLSAIGTYFFYPDKKLVEYQIAEGKKKQKPESQGKSPTGVEQAAVNQTTLEAIKQAQEALRQGGGAPETSPSPNMVADQGNQTDSSATVFTPYVVPDYPSTPYTRGQGQGGYLDDGANKDSKSEGGGASQGGPSQGQKYSGSSTAVSRSIYIKRESIKDPRPYTRSMGMFEGGAPSRIENPSIPVPPFGTRLPVRSKGAIFTLRDGGLAQFELPMDVKGAGWNLKRGTILVAKTNGSVNDRAFLSLVGFINPGTNKLVKVSGEVQGSDGSVGLKGKRRRINSRLASVLNRVANGGLALGQAALNRGGTTIVMGGLGSTGLGGDFGLSANVSRREFVEISAGAPAYILINDLPNELKGIDSDPTKLSNELMMTDEELADLLEKGDLNEIRAAVPRMSPDMKKLAMMILGERAQ